MELTGELNQAGQVSIGNVEGEAVKSSPEYSSVLVTHSVAFGEQTAVINGPRAQGFI